ncbi:hypothetical protein FA13DRAFT_1506375 [Coprinellus micaceus]|uniref:IMD domain-containing protein n=1 Tax=Coprinellus micaceus TaxID=71717 RepID=A0A4Y7TKU2_COPMI|nr:hypothetical protein FA13DRAFT_1506375 [Coprinellus micaceus]
MATPTAAPPLAERADIHKSCRSLESILSVLNEYCEAVGVVVALQKKLAKALREAAGLKATGEIAANALAGSATVFDALFEVDTKYTKFADKEYDAISAEVKKWFKKLVKEEKTHDQKLEKANARIKQAGQNFEKKSKKNASDAADEHARYINLISTLGPEISQEKYNHALSVTQRHNSTTSNVASCIARIADAEWLRACEDVRLLAPNIGTLTQWRMLCEGGWVEPMPQGLPDGQDTISSSTNTRTSSPDIPDSMGPLPHDNDIPATPDQPHQRPSSSARASPIQQRYPLTSPHISPNVSNQNLAEPQPRKAAPSPRISPNVSSQNLAQHNPPAPAERPPPPGAFDTLKPPFFDPTTGSVRTLSAFPAPPTHFPIPPVRQLTQASVQSIPSSNATQSSPAPVHFTESPISASQELAPQNERASSPSPDHNSSKKPSSSSSPEQRYRDYRHVEGEQSPPLELNRPQPIRATATSSRPAPIEEGERDSRDEGRLPPSVSPREPYLSQQEPSEFGEQRGLASKTHTYEALRRGADRTDSVISNGSLVAAMRDRYSSNTDSTSLPLQRDLPRIPTKVTDLAARYQSPDSPSSSRPTSSPTGRYQPSESPSSSRPRAASPPVQRQLSFPLSPKQASPRPTHRAGSNSISTSTPTIEEDVLRQRRQESDFEQRERELRERERELESRARELESQKAQLMTVHEGRTGDSQRPPISPINRPRRVSLRKQVQRPQSQMSVEDPPESQRQQRSQFSASPGPGRYVGDEGYRHSEDREKEHASYCGCHSCSVSKYAAPSATHHAGGGNALRPPSSPDKPKGGWMRRLSMPGGLTQAFSSDGKRNSSGYALGSGVSSATLAQQQKKGILSFDGRKNASATNLLRPPSEQGGGRRSAEGDRRRQ